MEIISVLSTTITPILEKIREEFAFQKFGTASFDTDEHRLLFITIDEETILSLVLDDMASIDKISPYAYFLAEKSAQILTAKEGDNVQITIPNFEYDAESTERLKNQIYQMRLDSGGLYRFKFVIIGDFAVGKTSIVRRYVDQTYSADYRSTIGLNVMVHSFKFLGNEVSLVLYDIGAQTYFKRLRKMYYRGAQAAFVVFDLSNRESYENATKWFEELIDFIENKDLPIVLVGNKSDLLDQRQIDYQEGVQLASKFSEEGLSKISYIETSALTGENIKDAFNLISYHYIMKSKEDEENRLKAGLLNEINSILEEKKALTLTFISENPFWTPGLQIINEIEQLGDFTTIKDEKEEKIYQYQNGLTLKNYLYDSFNISKTDGVLCIFDALKKGHIDHLNWKKIILRIIEEIEENKVVLIGIRVSENVDWSHLMEDFNVNEQLEQKFISLLFFKLGSEYRFDIYDQIDVMLNSIEAL